MRHVGAGLDPPTILQIILAVLSGLFIGLSGFTFYYARGYDYLGNAAKSCTNCHIMREQFNGWQKAAHHHVAVCNDCHVPQTPLRKYYTKAEHGYRHSVAFTFQNFHEPIETKESSESVVLENCVRCHAMAVGGMHPGALHRRERLDCLHCHRSAGH